MTDATSSSLPVLPRTPPPRGDLTRVPVLGRFLRWKHARTALQILLLLLAAVIVVDGLLGPQRAPENTAGVAPWIQWRGLVVLALLVFGNLFCMACPFMLPRRLAKRLLPADRAWPSWLKAKWLALGLLVAFFWAYEALDLWASPWLTAWLVVAYFAAAFVIDGFFKGAAFCKYACPIGSFHFVNSLASPGEVRVRDPAVCASCETKDCIAGRHETDPRTGERRLVQSGCELWLYQPRKVGNMDCTFCLDCVQACPYDNVGLMARVPGRELVKDRWRSGIGRFTARPDILALAMALVFLALLNAAGMIRPMETVRSVLGAVLGTGSEVVVWTAIMVLGLGVVPVTLLAGAGALSRRLARTDLPTRHVVLRMAFGLVPVGFAMWVAHYAFHFLGSGLNLVPVVHRGAVDLGLAAGPPDWSLGPVLPGDWLLPLELIALEIGLLGSLVLLYYLARDTFTTARAAFRGFLPWALLAVVLAGAGSWIMTQPMAMRGMMMPGMEMDGPGMEMDGPGMEMEPDMEMEGHRGHRMDTDTPAQGHEMDGSHR
ncbi:MAG: 4Fe-4S binding protein [Gemmatimonadota bacterium]